MPPPSGGVCGDACENYCGIVMQTCQGLYADEETCMKECEAFPADAEASATEGDSVQCRTYHASFPALADGATHCPHAGPDGGGVCGSYCDVYCDRYMENCPGFYEDVEACQAFCALFPTDGEPNAVSGNNVQCRIYHGNLPALADPDLHCAHGSLTGGDVCGSYCEVYCDNITSQCDGESQYPDRDSCLATCESFPHDGLDSDTDGNSVQCRIYHASLPASVQPDLHCAHAGITGDGVCGADPCEAYCDQIEANCPDSFTDRGSCMAACALVPSDGAWDAVDGNSVQCRAYHASFPAVADGALHCPHAGLSGADVCGDSCEFYCDLMETNCDGSYADRAECLAACAAFPEGSPGDLTGDTRECRIYHASFPAAADGATHCPHAGPDGAGVCVTDDPCNGYCDLMMENCAGSFPDRDACMATCALYPQDGEPGAQAATPCSAAPTTPAWPRTTRPCTAPTPAPTAAASAAATARTTATSPCRPAAACTPTRPPAWPSAPPSHRRRLRRHRRRQRPVPHVPRQLPGRGQRRAALPPRWPRRRWRLRRLCEVYRTRAMANCDGIYPNRDVCLATCAEFPADGAPNTTAGDSVQCRIYHGNLPAAGNPDLHCPPRRPDRRRRLRRPLRGLLQPRGGQLRGQDVFPDRAACSPPARPTRRTGPMAPPPATRCSAASTTPPPPRRPTRPPTAPTPG
ncbi:MAG: hypothetical protein R3F60_05170 [bacterium]